MQKNTLTFKKKYLTMFVLVVVALLNHNLIALTSAQTFSVTLDAHQGDTLGIEPALTANGVDFDSDIFPAKMDFRLGLSEFERFEFSANLRSNFAFGPLGNVLVLGRTELDTAGKYDVGISGEGVAASAGALKLSASAYNVNVGYFRALDAYKEQVRPRLVFAANDATSGEAIDSGVVEFGIGGLYRLDRTTVLELYPHFSWIDGKFAFYGSMATVFRKVIETDDIAIRIKGASLPAINLIENIELDSASISDVNESYMALGIEYRLSRRALPSIRTSVWLGFQTSAGELQVSPGIKGTVTQKLTEIPLTYTFEFTLEPYRIDGFKYHGSANLDYRLTDTDVLSFGLARAPWGELNRGEAAGSELLITTGYKYSF